MAHHDMFVAVDCGALPWIRPPLPNGELKGVQFQPVLEGGEGLPQVNIARYDPNWTETRHRHLEDEVLTLLEGELTVEGAVYRAPTVLFVGGGTLYGPLTAGADGAVLLRVAYTEEMVRRLSPP